MPKVNHQIGLIVLVALQHQRLVKKLLKQGKVQFLRTQKRTLVTALESGMHGQAIEIATVQQYQYLHYLRWLHRRYPIGWKDLLEIRKVNGEEYQPNTMHHIICGIMRYVRSNVREDIDFFKDAEFAGFRGVLDAEMKRLQSKGLGSSHKQAEPLTIEDEELLWDKKVLGDHSPESLLNTMIYMNGLYFAL